MATVVGVFAVALHAYFLSQWIYPVYYLGDQANYIDFWNNVSTAPFSEVWKLQLTWTGSSEPVFGVVVWSASKFFEKIQFFSIVNVMFSVLLFASLAKYRVAPIVYPLIFLNYYYILLLIPAERLKLSLVFVLVFILTSGAASYAAFGLGLLTHFQNLVILASLALARAIKIVSKAFTQKRLSLGKLLGIFTLSIGGLVILVPFLEPLSRKFTHYFQGSLTEAFDSVVMLILVFISCRDRITALVMFTPVVIAAILVGEARISMVAFLIFSGFFIVQRKSLHPVFVSILVYFNIKSLFFVQRVLEYNTGFGK